MTNYTKYLFDAEAGLTGTTDFVNVRAREIDFVTRFGQDWATLMEIMGIVRPIEKQPGSTLVSYDAELTLESGDVPEGDLIPNSEATVTAVYKDDLTLKKYKKSVSIESVNKYGAAIAVAKTDNVFRKELQDTVIDDFYTFLATGSLTGTAATFQAAVAKAIGLVKDKFKRLRKNATATVVFVNTLDVYDYLGTAPITIQTQNGIDYVKNFMGADTVILSSEIARGKVYATPVENIDLYYINPANADFQDLNLGYTVQGETNLIGFHAEGNYDRAVGNAYAIMGLKLWAEYLNGIANVDIDDSF